MQHVFIVGSKGIPGAYGGYETFVDKLTACHQERDDLRYHVACKGGESGDTEYHNARCFHVKVPNIGPAQAIWYDVAALRHCLRYIREHRIEKPIVYVLACRIGPFAAYFQRKIHALGGQLFVNPDGHEWLRAKWSAPVRKYWKYSESRMVRHADLLICDSKNIQKYIEQTYRTHAPATYIAYGADTAPSPLADDDPGLNDWLKEKGVTPGQYYLVVGRFVPENNYETMLREFMKSDTDKDLVLITGTQGKFYEKLRAATGFDRDPRIKFVGTVYDQALLKKLRELAFGYLHGHEVGGTNPSLLEALGSTRVNLLLDVGFNRECGEDAALYWTKEPGDLAKQIRQADCLTEDQQKQLGEAAKERIRLSYSWQWIGDRYADVFLGRSL